MTPARSSGTFALIVRYFWGWFLYSLGVVFRSAGNRTGSRALHERAARLLHRAASAAPQLTDARFDRAVLLWRELGRPAEAVAELDALLAAEPERAAALLNRGLAYEQLGEYARALVDLESYLAHPRQSPGYVPTVQRLADQLRGLADAS